MKHLKYFENKVVESHVQYYLKTINNKGEQSIRAGSESLSIILKTMFEQFTVDIDPYYEEKMNQELNDATDNIESRKILKNKWTKFYGVDIIIIKHETYQTEMKDDLNEEIEKIKIKKETDKYNI